MYKESICCITSSRVQANRAVNHLINAGFSYDEISVMFPRGPGFRGRSGDNDNETRDLEVGGTLGWLSDIGSFSLPHIGNFVVAGPLSTALGGPTTALNRGLIRDALRKLGVSPREARFYEESVERGETFVSFQAKTPDEAEAAKRIFRAIGAEHVAGTDKVIQAIPSRLLAPAQQLEAMAF